MKILDLIATSLQRFSIGIGGVSLKNNSGELLVRNADDTADASLTASQVNVSGDSVVINSDAANSGSDRSITLARPSTGMTGSYTLTLPTTAGTAGFYLQTDGNGVTSWVAASGATNQVVTDTTTLNFGSASSVSMFTLPANAVVQTVRVIIDTAFNGTPTMSVGITGTTAKYLASNQVDLRFPARNIFEVYPGLAPVGNSENLIITYASGSANAGSARVEVDYTIPS